MMNRRHKFTLSIHFRLSAIFLGVMVVLVLINIYIYMNVNHVVDNINQVYEKNFKLNELQEELQNIQLCMTEYLENKNTDSMENYYRHVQEYEHILTDLNSETVGDDYFLMEKNILNLSYSYISLTDAGIEYKRGRDVEKYRVAYMDTLRISGYLNTYIESLNNARFKNNSANYQALVSILKYTQKLSIGILFLAALATLVLVSFATRAITHPLRVLAQTANKVAEGTLDVEPVEISSEDEVGVVTKAFNQMLFSIRQYIVRVTENMERERDLQEKELRMETHLKEAQLNYLQAQINPHFLFNTLNAGAQLAMMEEADRTYEYIQNVADFYRYNVQSNKVVSLAEELELVDNYMYIIHVRYSGDIQYQKEITTDLASVLVPSMILQPIVENAIKYGVSGIEWDAKVSIYVSLEEDTVCVIVRDNGVGISEDVIAGIFRESTRIDTEQGIEQSNGVGLRNVRARMQLYYGRDDVMDITSGGDNMGTEVALKIPLRGK